VRSEQRVKEASEKACKECPLWRQKTDKLSGKYFNIIKELKQELRDLKTDCRAKIDENKRDIKD
jgi:sensor domain CHASE-containing protein